MKKILNKILFSVLLILMLCTILSCSLLFKYRVDFYVDKILYESQIVAHNKKVVVFEQPIKEGYEFICWKDDNDRVFSFDVFITKYIILQAYFVVDTLFDTNIIINNIQDKYIKGSVGVTSNFYEKGSFFPKLIETLVGSGVIYDEDETSYYVLTNYHVVCMDKYDVEIRVKNVYGDISNALLLYALKSYDLAILKFNKTKELYVFDIKNIDSNIGDKVFAIGYPKGQINSLTIGNIITFNLIEVDNSMIEFEVIWHDAPIKDGSSGGVLINSKYQVLGINFAGASDTSTGNFIVGYAIPSFKILEFLDGYKD